MRERVEIILQGLVESFLQNTGNTARIENNHHKTAIDLNNNERIIRVWNNEDKITISPEEHEKEEIIDRIINFLTKDQIRGLHLAAFSKILIDQGIGIPQNKSSYADEMKQKIYELTTIFLKMSPGNELRFPAGNSTYWTVSTRLWKTLEGKVEFLRIAGYAEEGTDKKAPKNFTAKNGEELFEGLGQKGMMSLFSRISTVLNREETKRLIQKSISKKTERSA